LWRPESGLARTRRQDGGHHDVSQWRNRPRGGNRAPHILDIDDAGDCNEIEQPEQERREQGESHDVASSGVAEEPSLSVMLEAILSHPA
jgi:hypothetical protein